MSDGEFQIPEYEKEITSFSEGKPRKTKSMTGVEKIAQERLEQKVKHHFGVHRDVEQNRNGELVKAALALLSEDIEFPDWDHEICKKMWERPYEQRLVIAGALIAAEIDRLNYEDNDKG